MLTIHFLCHPFKFVLFSGCFYVGDQLHKRKVLDLMSSYLEAASVVALPPPAPLPHPASSHLLPQHILLKTRAGI